MMQLVELAGVGVTFGSRAVLAQVSLAVAPAEIVTVIGPNGAGKTTLLRVVLGLQRASVGSVRRRPDLRIGYVPQRLALDATLPLSVRRFLALAPGGRHAERVAAISERLGIARLANDQIATLSGGELQRALLARALLCNPDLLVLDEPVQGVDLSGQADLYGLIAQLRDTDRLGILLVSHDLHLVMARTDRVVCLNRHVCCSGHPEAVARHPAYRALFGSTAEAIAVYAHHHDHRHGMRGETLRDGTDG